MRKASGDNKNEIKEIERVQERAESIVQERSAVAKFRRSQRGAPQGRARRRLGVQKAA